MIYCSHCGTSNRDGSKFCSSCGARLTPQVGLVCPMCGAANKVESIFCDKCNARLAPLIAASGAAGEGTLPLPKPPAPETPASLEEELPSQPVSETTSAETDAPDWLARLRAEPAMDEESPTVRETMPSWLQPAEPVAPAQESESEPEAEQPAWLRQAPAEATPPAPAEAETPDWLKARAPTPEPPATPTIEEPESSQPTVAEPPETEMPSWLKGLEPTEETTAPETPTEPIEPAATVAPFEISAPAPTTEPAVSKVSEEEIPDWLRAAPSAEETPPAAAPPELQPLSPEEMPDWVAALRPATPPPAVAEGPLETEGPLTGWRGVLPLAVAITEPHAPAQPVEPAPSQERGRLFESILAAQAQAAAPVKPRRAWTMRPLIHLLLALAVLVPFLIPPDLAGSTLKIAGTPAAEFYDTLQGLPANATVLLSFDYDPSHAGEMDLLAKAIVRHLIQRRVKIIALSTLDTGAPIAGRILDQAARAAGGYAYGANYVNLGYLPGHEAGLANLATNGFAPTTRDLVQNQELGKLPATANVKTLRDVQLVIELAGSEDALRVWMEQAQPRAGVPIVAGISAGVEPKARAYRDTPARQLAALVSGLVGAAQYEVLSSQPGLALVSVNAQSAAQLVMVLVVILGNLIFWAQALLRARGRAE